MKTFINIEKTPVPSYNLEVVSNAYNKLNEGHIQAIQSQSELQNAISQLDLNESEEDFRQGLINEIDQTVKDNTKYDNAYYALSDIIKKAGDINSNPELIGRLRAQQAYKANIANIDSRTDINNDIKEMAKQMSPYYYRDKNTGELINNGKWEPGYTPVKQYDWNDIIDQAMTYISPDAGQYTATQFYNSDGSISNTWKPGNTLFALNTTTNKFERVTEDKIWAGIEAAMKATPGIKESIEQDMMVSEWKDPSINNREIYKENGVKKTLLEYTEDRLSPIVRSKSYNNVVSSVNWYNDALTNIYKISSSNAKVGNSGLLDGTSQGLTLNAIDDEAARTGVKLKNINAKIASSINTAYPDLDTRDIDISNKEATLSRLRRNGATDEMISNISTLIDKEILLNADDIDFQDSIYSQGNNKSAASFAIKQYIDYGIVPSEDFLENNSYAKEEFDRIKQVQANVFNRKDLAFLVKNKNFFNELITELGGKEALGKMGMTIVNAGGKQGISLSKNNPEYLKFFSDVVSKVYSKSNGTFKIGNWITRNFWIDEDGWYANNDDGTFTSKTNTSGRLDDLNIPSLIGKTIGYGVEGITGNRDELRINTRDAAIFDDAQYFGRVGLGKTFGLRGHSFTNNSPYAVTNILSPIYNRLSRNSRSIDANKERDIETTRFYGGTPREIMGNAMARGSDDKTMIELANKITEEEREFCNNALFGGGLNNSRVRIYDPETKSLVYADSGEKEELMNRINSIPVSDRNNVVWNMAFNPYGDDNNRIIQYATIPGKTNSKGEIVSDPIYVTFDDLMNDENLRQMRNDGYWKSLSQLIRGRDNNKSVQFFVNPDSKMVAMFSPLDNENVSVKYYDPDTRNYTDSGIIVSTDEAAHILNYYNQLITNLESNDYLTENGQQRLLSIMDNYINHTVNAGIFNDADTAKYNFLTMIKLWE